MEIYRGEIWYVKRGGAVTGSEQTAERPMIVVSNNSGNYHSSIVEVVPLTTSNKKPLPTHVNVMCRVPSTALCECVTNVSQERLVEYIRSCTDEEMEAIDKALMIALGLEECEELASENEEVVKLKTERDLYKNLYEQLFERVIASGGRE